jgi:sporulation-control protein spo0M
MGRRKMVFGIGEGKIEVKLNKLIFLPGETITGTVWLKVNNPKKAKRVYVEFFGERLETRQSGARTNRVPMRVYTFSIDLDGEKEYAGEKQYSFEIKIPENFANQKIDPLTRGILQAIPFVGRLASNTQWYIKAALDLSFGIDISKRIQINIG